MSVFIARQREFGDSRNQAISTRISFWRPQAPPHSSTMSLLSLLFFGFYSPETTSGCSHAGDDREWHMTKFFEDVAVGDTFESHGTHRVTAEEIKDFARQWDPQMYLLDDVFVTVGNGGRLNAMKRMGAEIAMELQRRGVGAVVLPAT